MPHPFQICYMWPTDGTWAGRWQRWQFPNKRYYLQEIPVNSILEDNTGFPAIVEMALIPRSRGRFKFSQIDYETIVRQLVQGLEDRDDDEWSRRETRPRLTKRGMK